MAIDHYGRFYLCTLVAASLLVTAPVLLAQPPTPSGQSEIQQILKTNCQPCHNDTTKSSGLALTTRDAILSGGNRGAAVKPGNPADSLLVRAIEQSGELKMPPGRKFKPDEGASLRHWTSWGQAWHPDEAHA